MLEALCIAGVVALTLDVPVMGMQPQDAPAQRLLPHSEGTVDYVKGVTELVVKQIHNSIYKSAAHDRIVLWLASKHMDLLPSESRRT